MVDQDTHFLTAAQVLPLLKSLPDWGPMVTIVFAGGSVFEFKGPFPPGDMGDDFYNLEGGPSGLHGHLRLSNLHQVRFQDRPHRGRASYAFVFEDATGATVFKVFLGRDDAGEIFPTQLERFRKIQSTLDVTLLESTTDSKTLDSKRLSSKELNPKRREVL